MSEGFSFLISSIGNSDDVIQNGLQHHIGDHVHPIWLNAIARRDRKCGFCGGSGVVRSVSDKTDTQPCQRCCRGKCIRYIERWQHVNEKGCVIKQIMVRIESDKKSVSYFLGGGWSPAKNVLSTFKDAQDECDRRNNMIRKGKPYE